ncbi:MAG: putative polymerase, sigma-24 subunit, subfamily [Actinomycetia bacterium]|jgi:RNA polymerase sigma-70 factor (ECF subfamily)|nr:putative polymerase, sigma-24 subunit, subfamily [Actinomycetes bacterium]
MRRWWRPGNPVVRLNWAIARFFTHGLQEALAILDELGDTLGDYHLLAATRADLLRRAGRTDEAAELFRALPPTPRPSSSGTCTSDA